MSVSLTKPWQNLLVEQTGTFHFQNQLQITFRSSGMKILRAFLIIGCGFSSSAENLRLRGSKISCPGTLDRARSAGSGSYPTGTWMESGSMGLGVFLELGSPGGWEASMWMNVSLKESDHIKHCTVRFHWSRCCSVRLQPPGGDTPAVKSQ